MIGHFPAPYPDELLYSIVARLAVRLGYPGHKSVCREVTGSATVTAVVDLPTHLQAIVDRLPPAVHTSGDEMIDRHTLWPFMSAFQPSWRSTAARVAMLGVGYPHWHLGLVAARLPWAVSLRLCPLCVLHDRSMHGEAYWHRVHQVPGIEVCSIHRVPLRGTPVPVRQARNRHAYVALESIAHGELVVEDPVGAETPQAVLADGAAWLLSCPPTLPASETLRQLCLTGLIDFGYASHSGRLKLAALTEAFRLRYSDGWLTQIGCLLEADGEGWLARLLRKQRNTPYPLRHLLVLHFLGLRIETLPTDGRSGRPFGSPPWPCLNAQGGHYGVLTIGEVQITLTKGARGVSGSFACPNCGMRYVRVGPDESELDRFRRASIPDYGASWDAALARLWSDETVSLRRLSRELGVDPRTAKLQAARLGLPTIGSNERGAPPPSRTSRTPNSSVGSPTHYQEEWLKARHDHPEATRTDLRNSAPGVYSYLRRHCSDWLEAQSPARRVDVSRGPRLDWAARDSGLSHSVDTAASRLLAKQPPNRLTRTAILREARCLGVVRKYCGHLPLTHARLECLSETRDDFAVRRIQFVSDTWDIGRVRPTTWLLARRTGLRPEIRSSTIVREALLHACRPKDHKHPT